MKLKLAEHWRWRWHDAATGKFGETTAALMPRDVAGRYPNAERIPGSMRLLPDRFAGESYEETVPSAFYRVPD